MMRLYAFMFNDAEMLEAALMAVIDSQAADVYYGVTRSVCLHVWLLPYGRL